MEPTFFKFYLEKTPLSKWQDLDSGVRHLLYIFKFLTNFKIIKMNNNIVQYTRTLMARGYFSLKKRINKVFPRGSVLNFPSRSVQYILEFYVWSQSLISAQVNVILRSHFMTQKRRNLARVFMKVSPKLMFSHIISNSCCSKMLHWG